ncbi:MAG: T9SS type A sorting domain-containing protein, partial [Ignavibacterium sp.]|nr:T9SS type A sorting domain-containing protein [Ignavibacterium sp.]
SLSLGERVSEGRVRVTLKIYDVLGREVATLVNEAKEPGIYEVKFDASKLSSGVYIYRLTSKDFTASRKMMVVK